MPKHLQPLVDPRPIDPPEYFEEQEIDVESICIVDGCWGIYVPQQFCQRYHKVDAVSQEDWEICLAGPDQEHYWEAWEQILNDWQVEEVDSLERIWKVYLSQDGDLFQCRQLVCRD